MKQLFLLGTLSVLLFQVGFYYFLMYRREKRRLRESLKPMFLVQKRKSMFGAWGERYDRSKQGIQWSLKLEEMNLSLKPSEFMVFRLFAFIVVWIVFIKFFSFGVTFSFLCTGSVVGIGGRVFYRYRRKLYLKAVEEQLPSVCRMFGNSLRAGLSIPQALQTVARISDYPLGPHFRRMVHELSLGVELKEVFERFLERLDSRENRFFVSTLLIQKEAGGNLALAMERMAETLQERQVVNQTIRAATSEGRFTAIILPLMGLVFIGLFSKSFDLQSLLFNPLGILVVVVFIVGQMIGFLLVRKISNIEV